MSLENTRDIGTAKIVMVGAGGDSNVVPNPSGTATDTLEKIGINGTIYGIEGVDTLSDLTDTSISNPSTGQTIEYNSTSGKWENKLSTAVVANPSDTASTDITKIKIGSTAYNIPSGGSGMPENPLATIHGGTGNDKGYIRTGQKANTTVGTFATIEGAENTGSSGYTHSEGYDNTASNTYAHVEGKSNIASGVSSHAGGENNTASARRTHVNGYHNNAGYDDQTVIGKYNDNKTDTLFEVGNGTADVAGSRKNAFEVYSNGNIVAGGSVSNSNGVIDRVVANPSDTASTGLTKIKIGSTTYSVSGSGNIVSKTRYTINSSSWSSSQDVSGLYTYTLALNPTLVGSVNVYVAGSYDYIAPTDANKTNYSYVKRCNLNTSNLILRAYPKPDANFYIWVEGVEGTNGSGTSYETAGNVIQPNGASVIKTVGARNIILNDLSWDRGASGMYYATIPSSIINIPSGANIISAMIWSWSNISSTENVYVAINGTDTAIFLYAPVGTFESSAAEVGIKVAYI